MQTSSEARPDEARRLAAVLTLLTGEATSPRARRVLSIASQIEIERAHQQASLRRLELNLARLSHGLVLLLVVFAAIAVWRLDARGFEFVAAALVACLHIVGTAALMRTDFRASASGDSARRGIG